MNYINQVTIVGRLTRDPEVRRAVTGTAVASFFVATNHRYQDKGGQWKDETAFVPCVCFGRMAEQLTDKHKGEPVLTAGRLRTESWLKDGMSHSRLVLVTEVLNFLASNARPNNATDPGDLPATSEEIRKAVPF